MESDKEEPILFLDRTSRATRGKLMTKLLDDEVEEDEQYWNQEAFKEAWQLFWDVKPDFDAPKLPTPRSLF